MHQYIHIFKPLADSVANLIKDFEDMDPSATVLHGLQRSLQLDRYSCGVQCVWMILDYFGRRLPIESIARRLQTDVEGTAVAPIRRLLKSRGLITTIIANATLRDLKRALRRGFPALVSLSDGEHWAIVYGYSAGSIYVADPSITKNFWCRVSRTRYLRQWDKWMMAVSLN